MIPIKYPKTSRPIKAINVMILAFFSIGFDVVDGIERAPEAFIGLLDGRNFGKLVIKVADPM